jgi:hypothetical protein
MYRTHLARKPDRLDEFRRMLKADGIPDPGRAYSSTSTPDPDKTHYAIVSDTAPEGAPPRFHYSFDGGDVMPVPEDLASRQSENYFEMLDRLSMMLLYRHMEDLEAEQEKPTDAVHR